MAVYANISIDQGSDFESIVTVVDSEGGSVALGDYTHRGQVRKTYTSSTAYDFTTEVVGNGQLKIKLSSAQTGAMKAGRYVYDVEIVLTADGTVTRVIEGQLEVTPRVTRV